MQSVTSRDGTRIAYSTTGSGPAVIVVTGATAYPAIDPSLTQLAQLLRADITLVLYDRRGRGESTDTQPYAIDREIEDIAAVLAAVGGKAALYGLSSGAVLALHAAAKLPGITHVLAYEPPYSQPGFGPGLPADYVATLDRFNAAGDRSGAAEYFLSAAIGLPAEHIAGMKQSEYWPVMESVAPTIAYDGRIMFEGRTGPAIPTGLGGTAKVLVADGGASFPGMHEAAEAVAKAIPGAEWKTLGGQGHGPAPEAIAPVLRAFVAG